MIPLVRAALVAESPRMAELLLVAESAPWRPTDWSLVPAWSRWRAEVGAYRRPADQPDALLWGAYCEAEATLAARSDRPENASWWLAEAHAVVTEERRAA